MGVQHRLGGVLSQQFVGGGGAVPYCSGNQAAEHQHRPHRCIGEKSNAALLLRRNKWMTNLFEELVLCDVALCSTTSAADYVGNHFGLLFYRNSMAFLILKHR